MLGRRTPFTIDYNGTTVQGNFASAASSITYTDPASGESDSLSINLADADSMWTRSWIPEKGDKLSAVIGDTKCGDFILDTFSMSGKPQRITIGAVSAPAEESFSATDKDQTWEKVSVQQVAQEIAGRNGLDLVYDAPEIQIQALEQSEQTDSAFLQSLCDKYGLSLKIYSKKLVIFSRSAYKKKGPVATIHQGACKSWNYSTKLEGTYTGGEIAYTDPIQEKEVIFRSGDASGRVLRRNERADSPADAQRMLEAAIDEGNHDMETMSVSLVGGSIHVVASQCVQLEGFGRLSGKYYVNSVTHEMSTSGYQMSLELSKVP